MALTDSGSVVQGRPLRVQAWRAATSEVLAASVSSAQAASRSLSRCGDRGSSPAKSGTEEGSVAARDVALRLKKLLRPNVLSLLERAN